MSGTSARRSGARSRLNLLLLLATVLQTALAYSAQTDIAGPVGSVAFGTAVKALPNGNIVVTDPQFSSNRGAVYLYSATGAILSTLTGSSPDDKVGSNGITVLKNGNFVISSVFWNNGAAWEAGAATWVDGNIGLSGEVSAANSLVGSAIEDHVGSAGEDGALGVIALDNGNYLVVSPITSGGGAVTWANGATGLSGFISAANSLVGTKPGDEVGYNGVTLLSNGNYVVASSYWSNGAIHFAGAVTWGNGAGGISGEVSASNSLVGSTSDDRVGMGTQFSAYPSVTPLANGNYVVTSRAWHNGSLANAGAVTWGDGSVGIVGAVSAMNSLVGVVAQDQIGARVIALSNGNYVAQGALHGIGTWTWGNGTHGVSGAISPSNSLIGASANSFGEVVPLSNGNYVIPNSFLHDEANTQGGSATWADGTTGLSGNVSVAITSANTLIGSSIVTPLSNGNYVVSNPYWNNATTGQSQVGAVTWVDGSKVMAGTVSAQNSLVGAAAGDLVSYYDPGYYWSGVTALSNGNYVVAAPHSITWADGKEGLRGAITSANSQLEGSARVSALSNGNFVLWSAGWTATSGNQYCAIRWANGRTRLSGANVAGNALVGTEFYQTDEFDQVDVVGNGNYVAVTAFSQDEKGAISLGRSTGGLIGSVNATNSVIGTIPWGRDSMVYDYDAVHDQLVVGQRAANIISLLKADQLLRDTFE